MKRAKEIIKKIIIHFCMIYFLASVIANIAFYTVLTNQFETLFQDENNLIEQYKDVERNTEEQIQAYKQEKGENYPVIALLQYTQYILGAEVIISIQFRLILYSAGFSIVVVGVKELLVYLKIRKGEKKNG